MIVESLPLICRMAEAFAFIRYSIELCIDLLKEAMVE